MSRWSVPITPEPTKRTREPSSRAAFTFVVERQINSSASRTSAAVIARPSFNATSPSVEKASAPNGMFWSTTIFIFLQERTELRDAQSDTPGGEQEQDAAGHD